jgi:hypothetical protein
LGGIPLGRGCSTIDKNHNTHYSSTKNLSQNPEIFTINQPKSKQDKDQKIFYKTHSVYQKKSSKFFQRPTRFLHRKPNPSSEKSKSENFIISTNPTPLNFFTRKPSRTQIIFPYQYVFLRDFLPKNLVPINPKLKSEKLLTQKSDPPCLGSGKTPEKPLFGVAGVGRDPPVSASSPAAADPP